MPSRTFMSHWLILSKRVFKKKCGGNGSRQKRGFVAERSEREGYVYILTSPNCGYVKIGGSSYPPAKRLREINSSNPYRQHGPWSLFDFKGVNDWREVEHNLHYAFRSSLVTEIANQKELFSIVPFSASSALQEIDEACLSGKPKLAGCSTTFTSVPI